MTKATFIRLSRYRSLLLPATALLLIGCGGDDATTSDVGGTAGKAGSAAGGSSAAGKGGSAGSGATGGGAGAAGKGGAAGKAGAAGAAGAGGKAGAAGAAGKAGAAGAAGKAGAAGAAGKAGAAGAAGVGGAAGQGGVAGTAGAAGEAGTGGVAGVGGSGGAAGDAGTGGVGGDAGSGGSPAQQCTVVGDCTQPAEPCLEAVCAGTCTIQPKAAGATVTDQATGDCKRNECDGAGAVRSVNDDADIPAPVSSCETSACANGVGTRGSVASGTPCTDGGGKVCNGQDACVACVVDTDCAVGVCQTNLCVPLPCQNKVKDNDETDIDCGGSCGDCGTGQGCVAGSDCVSGACVANVCADASCSDGVQNADETGIDCGGACVAGCATGGACKDATDCTSLVCDGGFCIDATCNDAVQNGGETGLDCGGPCATKCATGSGCGAGLDCTSGVCTGNLCVDPSCTDLVKNADETGVDCGGSVCGPCATGDGCSVPGDCASGVCTAGICAAPTCVDTILNGAETGIDCGGTCPLKCGQNVGCSVGTDCVSGVCVGNLCQAPGCSDGVKNGSETGVDCGGACAQDCGVGGGCNSSDDCAGALSCVGKVCVQLLPTGGLVATWNLDGPGPTIPDRSGNGNDGTTRTGGIASSGKVGNGMFFDGSQCIGVPDSPSLSMVGGNAVTMMTWVRVDNPACEYDRGIILNKENTYEHAYQCTAANSPSVLFQEAVQPSSGSWFWTGSGGLSVAQWHHVATTWDGATVLQYIDGVVVAQGPRALGGSFADRATGFGIGCRFINADGSFPGPPSLSRFIGALDEPAVYNRALSATEIATYWSATK